MRFSIPDPAPNVDKDFFMVFEQGGVVKKFWAKEYNIVRIEDEGTATLEARGNVTRIES